MIRSLLLRWAASILALLVIANIVPGIAIDTVTAAIVAPLVIGFVNATVGLLLKIISFPLTILSLGISWLVINALMFLLAGALVDGFRVAGFVPAFLGSILLSVVNWILRAAIKGDD